MNVWRRWVRQPQSVWLRKALFQVHLWTGLSVGLYIVMISLTGSVLVYRNELYTLATPKPFIATPSGPRLTDDELADAATRKYEGYKVTTLTRARNPDQAVYIRLQRGESDRKRLFDPYTGTDLGESVPTGIWVVSKLIDLHDNLLWGGRGRIVNAFGALFVILLTATGLVIWWPGIKTWRLGLTVNRGVGWKRFTWDLHSMMGFWSFGFILLFGLTGTYLSYPQPFEALADVIQPPTERTAGTRVVDSVTYWLAYMHFGRLGGRGIPGCGSGLCDSTTKAIWAVFGLVPTAMFITGAVMWWNRARHLRRKNSGASPSRER